MKCLSVVLLMLTLASLGMGCGGAQTPVERAEEREGVEEAAPPEQTRSEDLSAYINAPVPGGIGNVIEKGPVELKVLGVRNATDVTVPDLSCNPELYNSVQAFTGELVLVDYLITNTSSAPVEGYELSAQLVAEGDPVGEFFQAEDAGFLTPSLFGDDIEPRQVVAQTAVFDVPPDVVPLLALFVEGSADQPTGERVGVDLSKEDPEAVTPEDLIHYAYALRLQGDAGGEKFYELLDSSSQEQVSREQLAAYFDLVGREVSVVDEWVVTDVQESGDAATISVNVRGGEPVPSEYSESGVNCESFQDSIQFDAVKADGAWRLVLGQETIQGIRDAA